MRRARPEPLAQPRMLQPVEVFRSTVANYPKYHLELTCPGVERVPIHQPDKAPEDAAGPFDADGIPHGCRIGSETFDSVVLMATDKVGRPCRACTLEWALGHILEPTSDLFGRTFVTFSGQPDPAEDGVNSFQYRSVSETGQDRLRRIAARAGLTVVESSPGPVAYGFLPICAERAVARNLRTYVLPDVETLPSPDTVANLWFVADNDPPERGGDLDEAWRIATRLAQPRPVQRRPA